MSTTYLCHLPFPKELRAWHSCDETGSFAAASTLDFVPLYTVAFSSLPFPAEQLIELLWDAVNGRGCRLRSGGNCSEKFGSVSFLGSSVCVL